jgi:hypothetical protein
VKFRKKPVVIDAIQFDGTEKSILDIMVLNKPMVGGVSRQVDIDHGGKTLFIHTLEGKMECSLNDWVIRGVKGETYPCKPDIFEATYEKVDEPTK